MSLRSALGPGPFRIALMLAAVVLASGCDATLPSPDPRAAAAPFAADESDSGSLLLGTYRGWTDVAVPGAVTTAIPLQPTGIPLAPDSYVLLRIGGTMIVEANPYSGGAQAGQAVFTLSAEQSRTFTGGGKTGVWMGGELLTPFFRADEGGRDVILLVRTGAQPPALFANRERMSARNLVWGYCLVPYCGQDELVQPTNEYRPAVLIEDYWISQSHEVSAMRIDAPLRIVASPLVPGSPMAVEARLFDGLRIRDRNGNAASVNWRWYPGDTAAAPNPYISAQAPEGCQDKLVCQFTPTGPGRMLVYTTVEGAPVEESQVLRIAGTSCGPEGAERAVSHGAVGCQPDARIELACEGDQGRGRVTRGQSMRCTVRKEPEEATGELVVEGWKFTGTDSRGVVYVNPDLDAGDGAVTDLVWEGKMALSGTVEVRARIGDGQLETRQAPVTVIARDWFQEPIPSRITRLNTLQEYNAAVPDTRYLLPDYPTQDHELGRSLQRAEAREPAEVLGFINDYGPNHRLAYMAAVPVRISMAVFVHPELENRGQFYRRQAEQLPARAAHPPCLQGHWSNYLNETLIHEGADYAGRPVDPRSHNGVFRREIQARAPAVLEDLVAPNDAVAELMDLVETRMDPVRTAVRQLSGPDVDTSFKAQYLCYFNYGR
ncbi:MAG TPA: hypothetical protein VF665_15470 [Longimicrobium sp.]|jgi:hypothetical protein|uniref:hypothetical protein n=1 Tax=Longimicrobium sp. TaxID=2029185 RepID=UPI002ED77905